MSTPQIAGVCMLDAYKLKRINMEQEYLPAHCSQSVYSANNQCNPKKTISVIINSELIYLINNNSK
jgi:hypothetical protein